MTSWPSSAMAAAWTAPSYPQPSTEIRIHWALPGGETCVTCSGGDQPRPEGRRLATLRCVLRLHDRRHPTCRHVVAQQHDGTTSVPNCQCVAEGMAKCSGAAQYPADPRITEQCGQLLTRPTFQPGVWNLFGGRWPHRDVAVGWFFHVGELIALAHESRRGVERAHRQRLVHLPGKGRQGDDEHRVGLGHAVGSVGNDDIGLSGEMSDESVVLLHLVVFL